MAGSSPAMTWGAPVRPQTSSTVRPYPDAHGVRPGHDGWGRPCRTSIFRAPGMSGVLTIGKGRSGGAGRRLTPETERTCLTVRPITKRPPASAFRSCGQGRQGAFAPYPMVCARPNVPRFFGQCIETAVSESSAIFTAKSELAGPRKGRRSGLPLSLQQRHRHRHPGHGPGRRSRTEIGGQNVCAFS